MKDFILHLLHQVQELIEGNWAFAVQNARLTRVSL